MIDLVPFHLAKRTAAVALICLYAAGCAGSKLAPATEPVAPAAPAAPIVLAEPSAAIAPDAQAPAPAVEVPATQAMPAQAPAIPPPPRPAEAAPAPRAVVPKTSAAAPPVTTEPRRPQPKTPAAVVPAPAPPAAVPKAATAVGPPQPTAAPLDLKSLESRLRQTKAIGVLTKLSLKNQVDDLLEKVRAYHKRQGTATLAEIRRNYDMLLLKVLSLLQDSDPTLARDIVKSRAAIWNILEDPRKFTESELMAGATP